MPVNNPTMAPNVNLAFNNGVLGTGFSTSVTRPAAGDVGANTPRFSSKARRFAAAPVITAVAGTTSTQDKILAAGYAKDRVTPVFVIYRRSTGQLRIIVGDINNAPTGTLNAAANASKGNRADLFREASAVTNYANEFWEPRSGTIIDGTVVLMCLVGSTTYNGGGNWYPNAVGLAVLNISAVIANPGNKQLWITRHSLSPRLQSYTLSTATDYGAEWSIQQVDTLDRDGLPKVECMVGIAPYASHPYSYEASFAVLRMTRPTTADEWVPGAVRRLPGFTGEDMGSANDKLHSHSITIRRKSNGGVQAEGSAGDGSGYNVAFTWDLDTLSDETHIAGGSDAGTNWYTGGGGGSGWSLPTTIDGWRDTEATPNDDLPKVSRAPGNQAVGLLNSRGGIIKGADEWDIPAIIARERETLGGAAPFSSLCDFHFGLHVPALGSTVAVLQKRWENFLPKESAPIDSSAMLMHLAPGAGSRDGFKNCCLVYFPEGANDGAVVANIREKSKAPAWIVGGNIYIGSELSGGDLRYLPIPATSSRKMLLVNPGGQNYLQTPITVSTSGTVNNKTYTQDPTLPAGYPAKPAAGELGRITYDALSNDFGNPVYRLRISDSIPQSATEVTVVLYVMARKPADQAINSKTYIQGFNFRFRTQNQDGTNTQDSDLTSNYAIATHGEWHKIVLRCFLPSFSHPESYTAAGTPPLRLFCEVWPPGGHDQPLDIYFNWHSVCLGDCVPYYVAPATTVADEIIEHTVPDLDPTNGWSCIVRGIIPPEGELDEARPTSCAGTATVTNSTTTTFSKAGLGTAAGCPGAANYFVGHYLSGFNGDAVRLISASSYAGSTLTLTHAAQTDVSAAGTFTGVVIHPQTNKFLFSISNADATAGLGVSVDTVLGALRIKGQTNAGSDVIEADSGGNTVTGLSFIPGAPISIGITCSTAGGVKVYVSVSGSVVATATSGATPALYKRLRWSSPHKTNPVVASGMWAGAQFFPAELDSASMTAKLQGLARMMDGLSRAGQSLTLGL